MFDPRLIELNEWLPKYWQSYVLGTLVRCVTMGREDLINQWSGAAGGTELYYSPPNDGLLAGVGIVRDSSAAIIAFQGTQNTIQLLQQIIQCPQGTFTGIAGSVNGYYADCFFERKAAFQSAIDLLPPSFKFLFCGHSAGGALAHIAYKWFDDHPTHDPIGCVTFGQPRTGNPTFAIATPAPFLRWIAQDDAIVGLPPNYAQTYTFLGPGANVVLGLNYRHARQGWLVKNDGSVELGSGLIEDNWGPPNPLPYLRLRGAWPACYNAHEIRNYVNRLLTPALIQGSPSSLAPYIAINDAMG